MPLMAVRDRPGRPGGATPRGLGDRDVDGMLFVADMYGLPVDLLATVLAGTVPQARAAVVRWHRLGYAESGRLVPGAPWVWLTRAGLAACGRRYVPAQPTLGRLAHTRAVATVRLALEGTPVYQRAGAFWRSERRLRARSAGRTGLREHLPDGEVHWPDGAGSDGTSVAWAGECWAIEAELTSKTVSRTTVIMRELLSRTGDYGGPAAQVREPGRPVRHSRVLYVCSRRARPNVLRARATLGPAAARVEVRDLPARAALRWPG